MSIQAMDWAWEQPDLTVTQKFLLVTLGNYANEANTCFPSVKKLARMCSLSDRAVQYALSELQQRGLIWVEARPGHSNLFHLAVGSGGNGGRPVDKGGEAHFTRGCNPLHPRGETSFTHNPQ